MRWYCRRDGFFEEETGSECPVCDKKMEPDPDKEVSPDE